jgi:hypothetical protein
VSPPAPESRSAAGSRPRLPQAACSPGLLSRSACWSVARYPLPSGYHPCNSAIISSPSVTPAPVVTLPAVSGSSLPVKIATLIQGLLLANQSRSSARELIFILSPRYLHAFANQDSYCSFSTLAGKRDRFLSPRLSRGHSGAICEGRRLAEALAELNMRAARSALNNAQAGGR